MFLLFNPYMTVMFFVLAAIALIGAIKFYHPQEKLLSVSLAVFTLFFLLGGVLSGSFRIVAENQVALIFDSASRLTGSVGPGIQYKPFFGSMYTLPASKKKGICFNYTPSIEGGIGVTLNVCNYIDMTKIDWAEQYRKYDQKTIEKISAEWRNQTSEQVALAVKPYRPEDLTEKRDQVSADIFKSVAPFYESDGIPVVGIYIVDWDFTDKAVGNAFNGQIVEQTLAARESAKLTGAVERRVRELYEVDTEKLIARERMVAFQQLGVTDQKLIVDLLWMQTFSELGAAPNSLVLNVGSGSGDVPIVFPIPTLEPVKTITETRAAAEAEIAK